MNRALRRAAFPAAAAVAVAATAGAAGAYRAGAPPGHTGGFGEPDCGACHQPSGAPAPVLELEAPDQYQPGAQYRLDLRLGRADLAAAGFQLTVRFADGPRAGRQAGELGADSRGVQVVALETTGVQYAGHDAAGVGTRGGGALTWSVGWTAPQATFPVVIHVAGNAANDDDSEFGDAVATLSHRVDPSEKARR